MSLKTALILRLHNAWRRGDDETAPNMTPPKLLGEAIDTAIALIELHDEMLEALEELNSASAHGFLYGDPARVKARAVIAKAKAITS